MWWLLNIYNVILVLGIICLLPPFFALFLNPLLRFCLKSTRFRLSLGSLSLAQLHRVRFSCVGLTVPELKGYKLNINGSIGWIWWRLFQHKTLALNVSQVRLQISVEACQDSAADSLNTAAPAASSTRTSSIFDTWQKTAQTALFRAFLHWVAIDFEDVYLCLVSPDGIEVGVHAGFGLDSSTHKDKNGTEGARDAVDLHVNLTTLSLHLLSHPTSSSTRDRSRSRSRSLGQLNGKSGKYDDRNKSLSLAPPVSQRGIGIQPGGGNGSAGVGLNRPASRPLLTVQPCSLKANTHIRYLYIYIYIYICFSFSLLPFISSLSHSSLSCIYMYRVQLHSRSI